MTHGRNNIVEILIKIGAIRVNIDQPFCYASGLKGPLYCDNRLIWSDVAVRKIVLAKFLDLINQFGTSQNLTSYKVIGLATGGIPHGMWVADKLEIPFGYIRSKAKGHGQKKLIEGKFNKGDQVLLVEDLVNQASSLEKCFVHLKEKEIVFSECFCLVNYQSENSRLIEKKYNVKIKSLLTFSTLLKYLKSKKLFTNDQLESLARWHESPTDWIS